MNTRQQRDPERFGEAEQYGRGRGHRYRGRGDDYAYADGGYPAEPHEERAAGRFGEAPRYRRDAYRTGYAPDEYALSETGEAYHPGRGIYDYDDEYAAARAGEFAHDHTRDPERGERPYHADERRAAMYRDYPREPGRGRPDHGYARGGEGARSAYGSDHGRPGYSGYGADFGDAAGYPGQGYQAEHRGYRSQRGRGPRGYTRSDERILEDVNERLSDDPVVDATDIDVRCESGRLRLEGRVPARWMKHRAEDIADSIPGAKDVENRIRVIAEERLGSQAGYSASGSDQMQTTGGPGRDGGSRPGSDAKQEQ
ncbi:BON domain-containing protein [Marilutibacter chinensis]|uniref:BON domain-containing protein n=1 Tax=Marilutibacter chinensis TaxID=2912247 RepID=A0ABS9HVN1_9GAMM|nr:BON domain-containing protein [Lysobacter chinensis]MCF7222405.1 BON domain-containing protein [Lysobacter chinensis]